MTARPQQIQDFLSRHGWGEARAAKIAGDASNRSYARLTNTLGKNAILMDAPPDKGEDIAPFVRIANALRAAGLSAPEVFHQDRNDGLLLIEDFGTARLAEIIRDDPARAAPLYRTACDVLLHLPNVAVPDLRTCDTEWLVEMVAPAFEWYAIDVDPNQMAMFQDGFRPFAQRVNETPKVLMLRDFHVENLMYLSERLGIAQVGLLDFQDAMLAHPAYDLVSILQDARRDVPPEIEDEMVTYFLDRTTYDPITFRQDYAVLGLQRNLRILGIFARLSRRDGKAGYVDKIPRVWNYMMRNLAHPTLAPLAPLITGALRPPDADHLARLRQKMTE